VAGYKDSSERGLLAGMGSFIFFVKERGIIFSGNWRALLELSWVSSWELWWGLSWCTWMNDSSWDTPLSAAERRAYLVSAGLGWAQICDF
jgi:hypothetical protein